MSFARRKRGNWRSTNRRANRRKNNKKLLPPPLRPPVLARQVAGNPSSMNGSLLTWNADMGQHYLFSLNGFYIDNYGGIFHSGNAHYRMPPRPGGLREGSVHAKRFNALRHVRCAGARFKHGRQMSQCDLPGVLCGRADWVGVLYEHYDAHYAAENRQLHVCTQNSSSCSSKIHSANC